MTQDRTGLGVGWAGSWAGSNLFNPPGLCLWVRRVMGGSNWVGGSSWVGRGSSWVRRGSRWVVRGLWYNGLCGLCGSWVNGLGGLYNLCC